MASILKIPVHVDIQIKNSCTQRDEDVTLLARSFLENSFPVFTNGEISISAHSPLQSAVDSIRIGDLPSRVVSFWQADLNFHPFRLSEQPPEKDYIDGEEDLPASELWELPNSLINGLWESIVVEESIKRRLLGYCGTSIQFADAGIDPTIISWNRMVLLHGPPGTGKTTLCKALAQKIYIRNSKRYSSGVLLEINSHSLFSKWFSESGKLVMKVFDHITEVADDETCFVAVLIDEVESITAQRSSSASSNEPGDAVRVVNAVLTSLDALKRRPNVLVLCTSNMLDYIDAAFRDRVDLQVYLGPPPLAARYQILQSCLAELMGKGIIRPQEAVPPLSVALHSLLPASSGPSAAAAATATAMTATASVGANVAAESTRPLKASYSQAWSRGASVNSSDSSSGDSGFSSGGGAEGCYEAADVTGPERETGASFGAVSTSSNGSSSGSGGGHEMQQDEASLSHQEASAASMAAAAAAAASLAHGSPESQEGVGRVQEQLLKLATATKSMSGRGLRKLPVKAHAFYLQRPVVTLSQFLSAMEATLELESRDHSKAEEADTWG